MILFQEVHVLVKILSSQVHFFFTKLQRYQRIYSMLYNVIQFDVIQCKFLQLKQIKKQ